MKKILIVNNNLDMGGIQKSLINLLKATYDSNDITLMLFSKSGSLLADVPESVRIITPKKRYCMLGLTRQELKSYPLLFIIKSFLTIFTKIFSRRSAMKILGLFQKKIEGYDVVISYTHLSNHKYFWNGCGDFVLDKTKCDNKICLIHCDYINFGGKTEANNKEYAEFDKIACCSDSVKERFIKGSAIDPDKVYTLRNFFDLSVGELAKRDPYIYDDEYINLISVARLSEEKGIDRAIEALHNCERTDLRYYIVGNGPQKSVLSEMVAKYNMSDRVFFLGEQQNPYRYMLNADYLLVPSLHEAAPMVFDEANVLGLKIISTNTTSAGEMVGSECGYVCENSIDGIAGVLSRIKKAFKSGDVTVNNKKQRKQLEDILHPELAFEGEEGHN